MNEIPSPGGWKAPKGTKAGWNWTPSSGASENFKNAPLLARLIEKTPFIDRLIYPWMWKHGYYLVHKPGTKPNYSSNSSVGYKKLR